MNHSTSIDADSVDVMGYGFETPREKAKKMVEMVSKHYILVVDFHDVYEARRWSVVTELLHEFWVTATRSLVPVKGTAWSFNIYVNSVALGTRDVG